MKRNILIATFLQLGAIYCEDAALTWTNPSIDTSDGEQARSVPENQDPNDAIETYVAQSSEDGTTISYSLVDTPSTFAIGSSSGVLTITEALDFETTPSYIVKIKAMDNASTPNEGTITLTVTVTDINEPPVFDPARVLVIMPDKTKSDTEVEELSATDPDGDTIIYSFLDGNDDQTFTIDGSKVMVRTGKSLNAATQSAYLVEIDASDGTLTSSPNLELLVVVHSCSNSATVTKATSFSAIFVMAIATLFGRT